MKKNITLFLKKSMLIFNVFAFILCTVNCSHDSYEESSLEEFQSVTAYTSSLYTENSLYSVSEIEAWNEKIAKLGWEKQLGLIMENQALSIGSTGLILKGYNYNGVIDKQEIKNAILNPNNLIPVYDSANSFKLSPINATADNGVNWIETQNNYLDSIYNTEIETVILNWSYKGNTFSTMALVSDQEGGIIYDNLVSNIKITQPIDIEKTTLSQTSPLLKSRSEESGGNIKKEVTKGVRMMGMVTVDAVALSTLTATGTYVDGQKSIGDYSEHSEIYTRSYSGYTANSQMDIKKFERGTSGYVDFIFAYYVAYKSTCTISGGAALGAFSISITAAPSGGSVIKDSGSGIIYASDLN